PLDLADLLHLSDRIGAGVRAAGHCRPDGQAAGLDGLRPRALRGRTGFLRRARSRACPEQEGRARARGAARRRTEGARLQTQGRALRELMGRICVEKRQPPRFSVRGVGAELIEKSAELSSVSWPSGSRTALEPGLAVT